jgi:hypothetical protein
MTNTSFIVCGLTSPRLEPTIYRSRGKHTITPPMWLNINDERHNLTLTYKVLLIGHLIVTSPTCTDVCNDEGEDKRMTDVI